ncbi:histidine--tRNA ligase [Muribaculum intestinale]|uniref:Histidine--tRNA ligase n=1 Tax=Muribaculum intestinale TaxID=1796646 RepID=A0A1B1S9I0_9BACT|nr:histidine--tRNA ligase [Muribaculum intestinale]ANU63463.1 histidine--tRNA ligase [Muribaculum intestinale]ASB38457.1 histidine--tRNA ligase [Muribaculum intestinale]PWB00511.1 histidine--tRNA ligase [Muribaculum intestinale]PWB07240.1 histidine--tRNA ligase [Muribaculum intestinale]QQR09203.1 histidine--tRNA ligase [Muribaculum intestinale]
MAQKPSIPKGTRDFSPVEMARRNYIFDTIREVFRLYGFRQIETPAMENLSTLMGKYGEEGDKLLFKILNSGNYLKSTDHELLNAEEPSGRLTSQLCEKGLRYDLTVPFARYVVMHRNELQLPFKRFQIQPVWRADRPQKGRYREFYQCDADIVGSDSLVNEIELLQIIDEVFSRLGIRIAIKLNNRKVLAGIAELIGAPDKLIDITVAIDKIDKIGIDNVVVELRERGLSDDAVERLRPILAISGSLDERLSALSSLLADTPVGVAGVEELRAVVSGVESLGMKAQLDLDVSLARGLNYYTGTIIEVKALDVQIGSITGGGRYDNLTGVFGMPGLSGVGISFGADRIYDVLNTLDLYPENTSAASKVIFLNLGADESTVSLKAAKMLRASGIAAEVYPDTVKMKKQMAYADAMRIPFVAIIGETELESGTVTLKDMEAGNQEAVALDDLVARLS